MLAFDISGFSEFFSDHPSFLTPSLVLIKTACTPMSLAIAAFLLKGIDLKLPRLLQMFRAAGHW
jgi:hypothetical protein